MNNLYLPLNSRWFNMSLIMVKREDYRQINKYWASRLCTSFPADLDPSHYSSLKEFSSHFSFKQFDYHILTLGYPPATCNARRIHFVSIRSCIGFGIADWGAVPVVPYFIIPHGEMVPFY